MNRHLSLAAASKSYRLLKLAQTLCRPLQSWSNYSSANPALHARGRSLQLNCCSLQCRALARQMRQKCEAIWSKKPFQIFRLVLLGKLATSSCQLEERKMSSRSKKCLHLHTPWHGGRGSRPSQASLAVRTSRRQQNRWDGKGMLWP